MPNTKNKFEIDEGCVLQALKITIMCFTYDHLHLRYLSKRLQIRQASSQSTRHQASQGQKRLLENDASNNADNMINSSYQEA